MRLVRIALHLLAIASLLTFAPGQAHVLVPSGLLGAAALALASWGIRRPWTDGVAWIATLAAVGVVRDADPVPMFATLLALLAALHIPPAQVPSMRGQTVLVEWGVVTAAIAAGVLWPMWTLSGRSLGVLDPATVQGTALRLTLLLASSAVTVAVVREFVGGRRGAAEASPAPQRLSHEGPSRN